MKENDKKKQVIKISVFVTSIFIIFLSVTYAFINVTLQGEKKQVITTGNLDLVLDEDENNLTITDALPMYDEVGMQQDPFTFRLINNVSTPTNYIVKLVDITTGDKLPASVVKYGLTKNGVGEPALLSTLPEDGTIDSGVIGDKETIEYTLRLWIDSSVTDNSVLTGKSLSYRVDVEVSQEIEEIKFIDKLATLAQETTTTFPDFRYNASETNGQGIFKFQEDGVDVYYWRGDVSAVPGADNHVIFADYCWEMIRTTKLYGIKMIYDGKPVVVDGKQTCPNTGTDSQLSSVSDFNYQYTDNAYIGYMYGLAGATTYETTNVCVKLNSSGTAAEIGTENDKESCIASGGKWAETPYEATHANVVNSTIKTAVDTWFGTSNINTPKNLEKLEDAVYCNDRSIFGSDKGYGKEATDFMVWYRLYLIRTYYTPSLECNQLNDRFTVNTNNGNGDLTFSVGLISADEISLAGAVYYTENNDYYLYTSQNYWTMSPLRVYQGMAYNYSVQTSGFPYQHRVNSGLGVRPVVTISSKTSFASGGEGTESNPYVVE